MADQELTWETVCILGWVGSDGHDYMTSWMGDEPVRDFLVTNVPEHKIPIWDAARMPPGGRIFLMPSHITSPAEKREYARSQGGLYCYGWMRAKSDPSASEKPSTPGT